MEKFAIGTKMYHYCYGPMTVVSVDENYVTTTVDDPDGFADVVKNEPKRVHMMSKEHRWIKESVGHWVFLTPEEVGTENNNFDYPYQPKSAMEVNPELLHSAFSKDKKKFASKVSTVGVKKASSESTVGVIKNGMDVHTGESAVGVVK